jgi:arylsulfatase A-like enzyme
MCTPTRAAIMTGRYPFRYGLQTGVILSAHTYGLPADEYLLPQALHDTGYYTAIIGKWHLGHADRKYWPKQRGFDFQYGPLIGELDYFTHQQHGVTDWYLNNKRVEEPGYITTLLGSAAVKLIQAHDFKQPLFLYLAFTAPHTPYQAPPKYLDMYKDMADPNRRAYAAMITAMDDEVGKVVAALEKKGVRGNTLIIFHSDNGGTRDAMFSGEGNVKGELPPSNGQLRGGKGTVYEGGTRVPALANWPGRIPAGSKVEGPMHVVDMYPTLAGLAGASMANVKQPFDGLDMWPALWSGAESPRREVVYNIESFRAGVRIGNWKLVWKTTLPAKVELFDLATDPYEKTDLSAQNPGEVLKLELRAQELATQSVPSWLMQTELQGILKRLAVPPALPDEEALDHATP